MKSSTITEIDALASYWLNINDDNSVIDLKTLSNILGGPLKFKTDKQQHRTSKLVIDASAYPKSPPVVIGKTVATLLYLRRTCALFEKLILEQIAISNILAGVVEGEDSHTAETIAADEIKRLTSK